MTGFFDFATPWLTDLNLIGKLVFAAALGVVIGYERSYHGRAAGMRTYALVAMGSAMLLMIHGFPESWFGAGKTANLTDDSTRVIQGIVTGIGFLGAGVIVKEGFSIRGLSTAASIWLTAAIGVLVGVGFYLPAVVATLITMVMMSEFRFLENVLPHQIVIRLEMTFKRVDAPDIAQLRARMRNYGFAMKDWSMKSDAENAKVLYVLALYGKGEAEDERLAIDLSGDANVVEYLLARERS